MKNIIITIIYGFVLHYLVASTALASLFEQGQLYFSNVAESEKSVAGAITALTQDRQGFIWIGTQHGLVRYDGYHFTHYSAASSPTNHLVGDFIISLWAAPDGRLWIGTRSKGLSVFDPATNLFVNYSHNPQEANSLADNRVSAVVTDSAGTVWVGTNDGLDKLDESSQTFTHFRHNADDPQSLNDNHIRALLLDHEDNLWVGSYNGLNLLPKGQSVFQRKYTEPEKSDSLAGHVIFRIFQASDGAMWVATPRRGAIRIDPQDGHFTRIEPKAEADYKLANAWVTSITQTESDEIWLGTNGGGLAVVNASSGKIIRSIQFHQGLAGGLKHNDIGSMLVDVSGLLWIGTWGAGINLYAPHNKAFHTLRALPEEQRQLTFPHVLSVMQSRTGELWVATQGNGIDVIDPNNGRIKSYRAGTSAHQLAEVSVQGLTQTQDGTIWAGTLQTGLYRLRADSDDFKRYTTEDGLVSNQIRRLLASKNGDLWIGTYQGLAKWQHGLEQFAQLKLAGSTQKDFDKLVLALAEQADGTLWVGTADGLYQVLPNELQLQLYVADSSLSKQPINDVAIDKQGTVWVSTSQGLFRKTADATSTNFQWVNPLFNVGKQDLGRNLLFDHQQRIWTSTHLVDLVKQTLHPWSTADGVDFGVPWDGSHTVMNDGGFAIGGTQGVLLIQPQLYQPWQYQPPLVISKLEVDNQAVFQPLNTTLPLSATARSFTVNFAALDYSQPAANQYAYQLKGYDPEWITTSSEQRSATYTNLDPGAYQLLVKGSNREGQWSPQQLMLDIIQQAAWHQTLWFRSLLVLLFLSLIYALYRMRIYQLASSERHLQRQVELQTQELSQQNNKLENALREVEKLARTDALTGLPNRNYLQEHIAKDILRSQRLHRQTPDSSEADLVFFMVDIDHFKQVNDVHGHGAGDQVLVQFADCLRQCFREEDMIIRWGGEEFLIVSRFIHRRDAPLLAERLRELVASHKFDISTEQYLTKTCSIGFASSPFFVNNTEQPSWEQVVNLADFVLYLAKNSGRNTWRGIQALEPFTELELVSSQSAIENAIQLQQLEVLVPEDTDTAQN
jgi:diguanylate cyclase (GGDEF)-like protein